MEIFGFIRPNVDNTIEAVIAKAVQLSEEYIPTTAETPQDVSSIRNNPTDHVVIEQEQLWCLCNSVASGNMIACDNKTCKVEWFHFECVKITRAPRGKWFCLNCSGGSTKRKLEFEDSNLNEPKRKSEKSSCPECGKLLSTSYLKTHMKRFCS